MFVGQPLALLGLLKSINLKANRRLSFLYLILLSLHTPSLLAVPPFRIHAGQAELG